MYLTSGSCEEPPAATLSIHAKMMSPETLLLITKHFPNSLTQMQIVQSVNIIKIYFFPTAPHRAATSRWCESCSRWSTPKGRVPRCSRRDGWSTSRTRTDRYTKLWWNQTFLWVFHFSQCSSNHQCEYLTCKCCTTHLIDTPIDVSTNCLSDNLKWHNVWQKAGIYIAS